MIASAITTNEPSSPLLVLTGPTAVGKTDLSLYLAESLGADILSADSRQIYRPLTIGTAKPSADELDRVRHHFINELDLDEPFSAGRFEVNALDRIAQLQAEGRSALIVGGSTLYLHALIHGLADIPPVDSTLRPRLMQRLADEGAEVLYAELQSVDPTFAATLDPSKTQRLVRGLEVYHGTGQPLSSFQPPSQAHKPPFKVVVLTRDRTHLYRRIGARVDQMLEAGLLDEVRGVLAAGFASSLNPLRTIGYQEPIAYLQGKIDYDEMVRLLKRNTRRYAKRQLTWFRRYPTYHWVDLDERGSIEDVLDRIDRPD